MRLLQVFARVTVKLFAAGRAPANIYCMITEWYLWRGAARAVLRAREVLVQMVIISASEQAKQYCCFASTFPRKEIDTSAPTTRSRAGRRRAMASLIAILDLKGKPLIQRSYKDDVPPSYIERFLPLVLEIEEDGQQVTPCFSSQGVNYMHIRHSNLYREQQFHLF